MYEVELKIELTAEEKIKLVEEFAQRGFGFEGVTPQRDYYVEAKDSEHGVGYDVVRYRQEGDVFIYTQKIWEMVDDFPVRRENEHEISKEEFETEIAKLPDAIKIVKDREWYEGTYKDNAISLTIDNVKFDHSPSMRYFIEAEISVADKNMVKETKDLIREFVTELLDMPEGIIESPGMFSMALKKL